MMVGSKKWVRPSEKIKIVYKKDRLRKYRLKKNTLRSFDFAV